jgi:hypothetical protein
VTHHSCCSWRVGSAAAGRAVGFVDVLGVWAVGPRRRYIPRASDAGFARAPSCAPTCTITRMASADRHDSRRPLLRPRRVEEGSCVGGRRRRQLQDSRRREEPRDARRCM